MPFALLAAGVIGAAVIEVFGPTSVRAAYLNIDLSGVKGISAALSAFVAVLILHELGHLLGAIGMRFQVTGVTLGPLRVDRTLGRNSWRFVPKNLLKGAVSAVPMDDRHWRARMLTVIATGPAASLLSAAATIQVLPYLEPGSWLRSAFSLLASLNVLVLLLGLVPNGRHVRKRNDAQLFLSILRDSDEAREIKLYHQLIRLRVQGVRPGGYPDDLIERLTQNTERKNGGRTDMRLAFAEALMKCAMDRQDSAAANKWQRDLVELTKNVASPQENLTAAEVACFDLLFRDDALSARTRFARLHLGDVSPDWLRHRLLAASNAARGNFATARREIRNALSSLPPTGSHSEFERVLLAKIENVIPTDQFPVLETNWDQPIRAFN